MLLIASETLRVTQSSRTNRKTMYSHAFILVLIAALSWEKANATIFGACIETCSIALESAGVKQCDDGHVCKSNGCGHTCQLAPTLTRGQRGACVMACSSSPLDGVSECAEGYECRHNGCGQTCQRVVLDKRQRCAPVLCKLYCPNGFALDEHECEICACKE